MIREFALDLKVARRKSGLTQQDCAYLIGVSDSKISMMESGKIMPSLKEICALSTIYNCSFESLFNSIFDGVGDELLERVIHMPDGPDGRLGNYNRQNTLGRLYQALHGYDEKDLDD